MAVPFLLNYFRIWAWLIFVFHVLSQRLFADLFDLYQSFYIWKVNNNIVSIFE